MDDSKRRDRRAKPRRLAGLSSIPSTDAVPDEPDAAEEEEGVTLEELRQSYQRQLAGAESDAAAADAAHSTEPLSQGITAADEIRNVAVEDISVDHDVGAPESSAGPLSNTTAQQSLEANAAPLANPNDEQLDPDEQLDRDQAACPLTPQSIVEAILFVGRPDGGSIPATEIAGLMRGVDASEVTTCVAQLNELYAQTNRATRIVADGAGYRVQLADEVSYIRDRFYGRVRQVKLNQAAIDCLALIAYQPGILREKLEQQRGQPSGGLLSQLIRRQLIEVRRVSEGKKSVQRYYPTHRLLDLAGIDSLDDLPQTEDLE